MLLLFMIKNTTKLFGTSKKKSHPSKRKFHPSKKKGPTKVSKVFFWSENHSKIKFGPSKKRVHPSKKSLALCNLLSPKEVTWYDRKYLKSCSVSKSPNNFQSYIFWFIYLCFWKFEEIIRDFFYWIWWKSTFKEKITFICSLFILRVMKLFLYFINN